VVRSWITGDDTRLGGYLYDVLGPMMFDATTIDPNALKETPGLLKDSLVIAGFTNFDDRAVALLNLAEEHIGHGELLLFLNAESKSSPLAFSVESMTPIALLRLVEKTAENIELKKRLTQLEAEQEASLGMGTELISGMAHDLRAPLNSILGFSELLEGHAVEAKNEKQSRYAANIGASGRVLLQLIDDIVDLAKIDTGKVDLQIEPVDVTGILHDVVRLVKEKAQKRGVAIDWKPDSIDRRAVRVDRKRFRQALYLLLNSEVELREKGSRLLISVQGDDTTTHLKFDHQRHFDDGASAALLLKTPTLPAWQQLYVEHVLTMHGVELIGWGRGSQGNGSVEIRIPESRS